LSRWPAALAVTMVVLAGCATASKHLRSAATSVPRTAAPTANAAATTTSTVATPTTVRPTTTTRPRPRPLAVPARIAPLAAPVLPGEGAWRPAGSPLANGFGLYTTFLRPAAGDPAAGIAWIDPAATRISLYAGDGEPGGVWPQQGEVPAALQPRLLAAFNSGFKIYSYQTGWYDQGRAAVALQPGQASLVIFANGTATVADWGRDATLGSDVVAVRQNLTLLVDHGAVSAGVESPGSWGAVLGGGVLTWRSGIGVTAAGDLVYVAGPALTPAALADLLVAARAVRGMELDINPEWVSFSSFRHAGGAITGSNLVSTMYFSPAHYLQPYSRDFFAVFAR
jgi:hypothetical protein